MTDAVATPSAAAGAAAPAVSAASAAPGAPSASPSLDGSRRDPTSAASPPLPLPVVSAVPVLFRRPPRPGPTRYVQLSNCGPSVGVSPSDVAALLAPFGPGVVVHVPADPSAGYLHASFPTVEQASRAIAAMDGSEACGRVVHAHHSEPREEKGRARGGVGCGASSPDSSAQGGAPVAWLRASELGVPGVSLLESFVSEAEEAELLRAIDAPALADGWELLARRRVLHFGRAFSYVSRGVDDARRAPEIDSAPVLRRVADRVARAVAELGAASGEAREAEAGRGGGVDRALSSPARGEDRGQDSPESSFSSSEPAYPSGWSSDQVTVNEYPLGVGISPHVDTHSAFSGPICSLSLASDASMTFRRAGRADVALRLPRRSLVVMAGEGRLAWQHYVPHRRADAVVGMGRVARSERRVSCTFRMVREASEGESVPRCRCAFPADCDSRGGGAPPTRRALALMRGEDGGERGGEGVGGVDGGARGRADGGTDGGVDARARGRADGAAAAAPSLAASPVQGDGRDRAPGSSFPPACAPASSLPHATCASASSSPALPLSVSELSSNHVVGVYDVIAPHFSSTRFSVWPAVRAFVEALPPHSLVADLGCGNGKYLGLRDDCYWIGSDRSTGLLDVAARRLQAIWNEKMKERGQKVGAKAVENPKTPSSSIPVASETLSAASPAPAGTRSAASSTLPPPPASAFPPNADVYAADALAPFLRSSSLDAAISIAVLHHLPTPALRLRLLAEMRDALRPGGRGLVTVWATEQGNQKKSVRARGSTLAAMHARKGTVELERYYHLFEEGELAQLVRAVPELELSRPVFYDRDNWCAEFVRIRSR